ncbi:MAG: hypothetical protein AAGA30_06325 [Planctomycetota bacterium]
MRTPRFQISTILARTFASAWVLVAFWCSCSALAQESTNRDSVKVDQTVLLVNDVPFCPKIVQHNGETFSFLKSLGFNTIQLSASPSDAQLKQAADLDVWLICPPPASTTFERLSWKYNPVLVWAAGDQANHNDLQLVRELIRDLQDSQTKLQRPVFAHADSSFREFGVLVDVVGGGRNVFGTQFVSSDYSQWLSQTVGSAGKVIWSDIPTEVSAEIQSQTRIMTGLETMAPVTHGSLRKMLHQAVTGGARGFRFLSRSRLDQNNPETELRTATIGWLNQQLDQISPWIAGGLLGEISKDAEATVHSLKLVGSEVFLIQRTQNDGIKSVDFYRDSAGTSDRLFLVDELGIRPLRPLKPLANGSKNSATTKITVPNCESLQTVLVTRSPNSMQVSSGTELGDQDQASIQLRFDLVERSLSMFARTEQLMAATGQGFPMLGAGRDQATKHLQTARRMSQIGDWEVALTYLKRADAVLSASREQLISTFENVGGLHSTPLTSHFNWLPWHVQLGNRLAGISWSPNNLTAGDFEDLSHMTKAGWTNQKQNQSGTLTQVELSKEAAYDGTYGMAMTVSAAARKTTDTLSRIQIESAEVYVRKGQLVRIHGHVNIPVTMGASYEGLKISDSIGGDDLAIRVSSTSGWEPFTLYRKARKSGPIQIRFSMMGYGRAMIDEVTCRVLELPGSSDQLRNARSDNEIQK